MTQSLNQSPGRGRGVTAVLGPTNTGKTHLAIERMLGHDSGMIGLPLRLLAREVYDKVCERAGQGAVALITGEEKVLPPSPRYYVCTVEAMPRDIDVAFLAVDEIQLAADQERGHVFTRHLLQARGTQETLLLGAATMKDIISSLLPDANIISRPRLSKLTYAGQKKLSRLPRRSAVVTFTANDVYATAELVRRQRGGAAVVLGALSPKTRNAQVGLYQSGEVDFLVATDAIGMGLNLALDHVAFASTHKFDGRRRRELSNAEIGQIGGRAGRHTNDGTFGVTASVPPFEQDRIDALEDHIFEPVKVLQWRNGKLDFSSVESLLRCLKQKPEQARLVRGGMVEDLAALETVTADDRIKRLANAPAAIARLWDVCQIPDYRKISATDHADLVSDIYLHLMSDSGLIDTDWFAAQVAPADNTEGDIDALSNRISHVRTWTFVSHRNDWLSDPSHWQERTRAIEEKLSDALHERLTQRFVDRRTSVLVKRLRDRDSLNAEIGDDGSVHVERHLVGRVDGFRFTPDTRDAGIHGKAARHAAARVMTEELSNRAQRLVAAVDSAFHLSRSGGVTWEKAKVAQLEAGENPLQPNVVVEADEHLNALDKERVQGRIETWLKALIAERVQPLHALSQAEDVSGLARGVAFRLVENFGIIKRDIVAEEIRQLDQDARGQLRRYGVRFGAFNIFVPVLLKPAASDLLLTLWFLSNAKNAGLAGADMPEPPRDGLTSTSANPAIPESFYRVAGYHLCGRRVVRIDMLERLADMIRPVVNWRATKSATAPEAKAETDVDSSKEGAAGSSESEAAGEQQQITADATTSQEVPAGATGDGGFRVTADMMSIVGCSGEEMAEVLKELGFRRERLKKAPSNGADAATSEAKGESADEEESAEEFDEIWRPRKRGPNLRSRSHGQKKRDGKKAGSGKGRGKKHRGADRPGKASAKRYSAGPKKKEIDPDSPFAALQTLKEDLETGAKD